MIFQRTLVYSLYSWYIFSLYIFLNLHKHVFRFLHNLFLILFIFCIIFFFSPLTFVVCCSCRCMRNSIEIRSERVQSPPLFFLWPHTLHHAPLQRLCLCPRAPPSPQKKKNMLIHIRVFPLFFFGSFPKRQLFIYLVFYLFFPLLFLLIFYLHIFC